jgi:hypothetical protein
MIPTLNDILSYIKGISKSNVLDNSIGYTKSSSLVSSVLFTEVVPTTKTILIEDMGYLSAKDGIIKLEKDFILSGCIL